MMIFLTISPSPLQCLNDILVDGLKGLGLDIHAPLKKRHYVDGRPYLRLAPSECLSNKAFHPVSRRGEFLSALGGTYAKPAILQAIGQYVKIKNAAFYKLALVENPLKLGGLSQPFILRKGRLCRAHADSTFLPLRRLRLKTFLPPAVFILLRKPQTLLRCLFDRRSLPFFIYPSGVN